MPTVLVDEDTDGGVLIPAPGAGKSIQLLGWDLTANGQVVVSFKSGSDVLWLTYAMNSADVLGGIVIPINPDRDMFVAANTALTIGLSGTIAVGGSITYAITGLPG